MFGGLNYNFSPIEWSELKFRNIKYIKRTRTEHFKCLYAF